MPDIDAFAYDMQWWCQYGDLGYDQWNRWDLRVGGETDCSALVIGVLKARGGSSPLTRGKPHARP